jgi:rhamnogalacturonan hydrolase
MGIGSHNLSLGHGNAYSLDIDSFWSGMSPATGNGVSINNITFNNWKGTEADGYSRGPLKIVCSGSVPCTDITIENFALWTEAGSTQWYECGSAYGSGFCLDKSSDHTSYAVTTTWANSVSSYSAPTMAADLATSFGTTQSIPIPTIPSSFYPGITPISQAPKS